MQTAPAITMNSEVTVEKTGRLMKKSENKLQSLYDIRRARGRQLCRPYGTQFNFPPNPALRSPSRLR
jgi:galactokinase